MPSTMSVALVDERLKRGVAQAKASSAKRRRRSRTASQIGLVHESSSSRTRRDGSRTGSGLSARLFRIEKSAVTPPIPRASETTAKAVTIGAARSDRQASRQSTVNVPRIGNPARRSAAP